MLSYGNDELKDKDDLPKEYIDCYLCNQKHEIKYGQSKNSEGEWVECKLLAFFKCSGKTYLCGIDGKDIRRR